jgi:hypothetical protein
VKVFERFCGGGHLLLLLDYQLPRQHFAFSCCIAVVWVVTAGRSNVASAAAGCWGLGEHRATPVAVVIAVPGVPLLIGKAESKPEGSCFLKYVRDVSRQFGHNLVQSISPLLELNLSRGARIVCCCTCTCPFPRVTDLC